MGEAADRLTRLVHSDDRYDIPFEDVRAAQVEAMNERFQERKDAMKLLRHRAGESNLSEISSHEDAAQLLFPHTAYKSYPESFLSGEKWDRLGKWMDTVSSHRVPPQDPSKVNGIDDWMPKLQDQGFYVSYSSGTTGKSAMLVASKKDMEWCKVEAVAAYSWGSGVKPAQDRRIIGMAATASVPRNFYTGEAYTAALQDPKYERFIYPVPPITVGGLTQMVVLRKAIAAMAPPRPAISRNSKRSRPSARRPSTRRWASPRKPWWRPAPASFTFPACGWASTMSPRPSARWAIAPRTFTRKTRSTWVAA